MTVQNIERRAGPYVGDGVVSSFSFGFKVFTTGDVLVNRSVSGDENSEEEALKLETDYSVTLNLDQDATPGGTVTLTAPLTVGLRLTILSAIVPDQQTELTNHDGFWPETLNEVHDKAIALIQELKEETSRALKVPSTSEKTPEQVTDEILSIAAEANEYAAKAEETYQAVLETQREVLETQTQITEAQEEVEKDRQEVSATAETVAGILERAEEIDEGVSQLVPIVDDIDLVGDHMVSVITVADDLQGYPIDSMDFGLITEPPEPTTVVDGGNVKTVADSIDDVVAVSSNLEEVLQADDNAATATQKASEASASASAAAGSANAAKASEDAALASQNAAKASADAALASQKAAAQSAVEAAEAEEKVVSGLDNALKSIESAETSSVAAVNQAGAAQITALDETGTEWSNLAEAWAHKMDGKVEEDAGDAGDAEAGYSSRYYAAQAKSSADQAAVDEEALATTLQQATAQAEAAAASASAAATSETKAAQSATASATSQGAAEKAQTAAESARDAAIDAQSFAESAVNAASSAASAASQYATNAQTSATAAATSEKNASSSASASAESASAAKTSETNAKASETAAESAKTAAETAQAAAEAARDEAADISESIGHPLGKEEADTTYAPISHTHSTSEVKDLDTALSGKAASDHTHTVTASGDATGTATLGASDGALSLALSETGVTAGSYGPATDATLDFGGAFTVPVVTVDAKGRVTVAATRTFTMPAEITWESISGRPDTFTPATHKHKVSDVSGLGTLATKSSVGATELADQIDLGGLA